MLLSEGPATREDKIEKKISDAVDGGTGGNSTSGRLEIEKEGEPPERRDKKRRVKRGKRTPRNQNTVGATVSRIKGKEVENSCDKTDTGAKPHGVSGASSEPRQCHR